MVRLVRCAPATPSPSNSTDVGELFGISGEGEGEDEDDDRLVGGFGRNTEPSTAKLPKRTSQVSFGMPTASGMLDTMLLQRLVVAKVPEIRACFDRELAANPMLGRTSLAWRLAVAQDGRVLYADPTSRSSSNAVATCVSRVLRTMLFPTRATGGSITVTYPIVFDVIVEPEPPEPPPTTRSAAWTPFGTDAPVAAASRVARAVEAALHDRRATVVACFPPAAPTGSLRAMIEIDDDGKARSVQAGGLGHAASERCVEQALSGMTVVAPAQQPVEIACDYARGDAQPWRVTPAAYRVITTSRKQLRYESQTLVIGAPEPEPLLDPGTYLVLADADATGAMVTLALQWASEGNGAIIAVRDGARAPIFLGVGRTASADGIDGLARGTAQPGLRLGAKLLTACVGRATQRAKLADVTAVGSLVQWLATRCKTARCISTLSVALDPDAIVRDLVEVIGAARRAGFDRVLLGTDAPCGTQDDDEGRSERLSGPDDDE